MRQSNMHLLTQNHRQSLYVLSFFLLDIVSVSATLCYTPDGTLSSDQPCNLTASASVCCEQGFYCTSNGLCQPANWWNGVNGNPLQFIRGTCTDKTWAAPECGSHCIVESVTGGEWVMRCGANADKWCCSADNCCSNSSIEEFALGIPTVTATAGVYGTSTATPVVLPTTTSNSNSSMNSTGNSTATATTTTRSGYITNPSSVPTTSNTSPSTSDSTKATAIGIGVGVGVGVAALAGVIGAIVLCLRKKKHAPQEETQRISELAPQYPGYAWNVPHYSTEAKVLQPSELDVPRRSQVQELDSGYAHGTRI